MITSKTRHTNTYNERVSFELDNLIITILWSDFAWFEFKVVFGNWSRRKKKSNKLKWKRGFKFWVHRKRFTIAAALVTNVPYNFPQQQPTKTYYYFHLQMKVIAALVIAAFCVATCFGQSNSTDESRIKRQAGKPTKGRFLSLPVPQKCASRKCLFLFFSTNFNQFQWFGEFLMSMHNEK